MSYVRKSSLIKVYFAKSCPYHQGTTILLYNKINKLIKISSSEHTIIIINHVVLRILLYLMSVGLREEGDMFNVGNDNIQI